MKIIKTLLYFLAMLAGATMFIYAEVDDSPGGQMIGLIIAIIGVVGVVKGRKITN